ncbi:MAG: hypothetical protein IKZ76_05740 [Lachnospiraceae bacterium]|nr:hypothetical protein [Lachnospiraceae bacterium]
MFAKFSKKLIAVLSFMSVFLMLTACGETPMPGSQGTYYFVYEKGPLATHTDYDYTITLDGYGKGVYLKKGNEHKLKYTYTSDGKIEFTDQMTRIKYNGTIKDGVLLFYDEDPESITVTEYYYTK